MNKLKVIFLTTMLSSSLTFAQNTDNPFSPTGEEWEGDVGELQFVDPRSEQTNWAALINRFGGRVLNAMSYPQSAEGFKNFMKDSGVTGFDPVQIITPPSKDIAKKCGITYLLPDRSKWMNGAAIALWAQAISQVAQETPVILNWYRNPCYNKAVGGATSSDHLQARSADLDFATEGARRRSQHWLCTFWNSSLNMQVGLGGSVIHLGSQSPRGKRNWYYPTYKDPDEGKTCFD